MEDEHKIDVVSEPNNKLKDALDILLNMEQPIQTNVIKKQSVIHSQCSHCGKDNTFLIECD